MTMWYRGQPVQGPLLASSVPLPRDEEFAKMLAPDYDEQDEILMSDIWWYDGTPGSVRGGVNLTKDFENALGYAGEQGVVFELAEVGDVAGLDFGYGLAKSLDDVRVVRTYADGAWSVPEVIGQLVEELFEQMTRAEKRAAKKDYKFKQAKASKSEIPSVRMRGGKAVHPIGDWRRA